MISECMMFLLVRMAIGQWRHYDPSGESAVVARAPVMLLLPVAAAVEVFGLGVLNERLSSE